jgi:hypothetical protein
LDITHCVAPLASTALTRIDAASARQSYEPKRRALGSAGLACAGLVCPYLTRQRRRHARLRLRRLVLRGLRGCYRADGRDARPEGVADRRLRQAADRRMQGEDAAMFYGH